MEGFPRLLLNGVQSPNFVVFKLESAMTYDLQNLVHNRPSTRKITETPLRKEVRRVKVTTDR